MSRPRLVYEDGRLHPLDIAKELGITRKKAQALGFRSATSPLARQVLLNDSNREGNLPSAARRRLRDVPGAYISPPKNRRVAASRRFPLVCVVCGADAVIAGLRNRRLGYALVCTDHRVLMERRGCVNFQSLLQTKEYRRKVAQCRKDRRRQEKRRLSCQHRDALKKAA